MAYGAKMDALRTDTRVWFWDGEFRHEQGAIVTTTDVSMFGSLRYSVFRSANVTSGNRSCGFVVANYHASKPLTADVSPVDECSGALSGGAKYRLVDGDEWLSCASTDASKGVCSVALPPMSAAVVVDTTGR